MFLFFVLVVVEKFIYKESYNWEYIMLFRMGLREG